MSQYPEIPFPIKYKKCLGDCRVYFPFGEVSLAEMNAIIDAVAWIHPAPGSQVSDLENILDSSSLFSQWKRNKHVKYIANPRSELISTSVSSSLLAIKETLTKLI